MDGDAIDRSLQTAPVLDRGGYPYVVHPLLDGIPRVDPGLLIAWAEWAADQEVLQGATLLVAPEAMGLPLATAISMKTGIPYVAVRKREYGLDDETVAYCETGYAQTCLYINDVREGDRVVLVDDVLSTGGTADALLTTLKELGATIQGAVVFVDKGDRAQRLEETHGIPIHVMRRIQVTGDRIQVEATRDDGRNL